MVDGYLTFEDGKVTLGGNELDGLLQQQYIRGAVRFDEAAQDGLSGKIKTPMGWEDADITLTILLETDDKADCYDRLAELDGLFKGQDNGGNPRVLDVLNRHCQARHINQVVFSGLDSSESNKNDAIRATLSFTEHRPAVVAAEERVVASGKAAPGIKPVGGSR
ncbi:hypothetical protein [Desulfovibrio sp. UCD-KL4C]|uniref:hypothetical protein n=1 Tax=Desulfovibrio sp. UCD-KL4C TaxID=2578120 RepID=UPI0025B8B160|nr:hypothetical protein [Desulfovibrio sp. UCD-KL4C]